VVEEHQNFRASFYQLRGSLRRSINALLLGIGKHEERFLTLAGGRL
jgi:hypothetical protein